MNPTFYFTTKRCGLGILPNIIFWNVHADTFGYPAAADQKGVMLRLLSGYSPALMKFILSGEMEGPGREGGEEGGGRRRRRRRRRSQKLIVFHNRSYFIHDGRVLDA